MERQKPQSIPPISSIESLTPNNNPDITLRPGQEAVITLNNTTKQQFDDAIRTGLRKVGAEISHGNRCGCTSCGYRLEDRINWLSAVVSDHL